MVVVTDKPRVRTQAHVAAFTASDTLVTVHVHTPEPSEAHKNQYVFVGNNPVNRRDPLGLQAEWFPSGPDVPPGTIFSYRFDPAPVNAAIANTVGHVWTAPNTALGLTLGGAGMLFGGDRPNLTGGAIEFQNNPVAAVFPIYAITLGDVINYVPGINPSDPVPRYDQTGSVILRSHELVHVPQEWLWGPFFIPAYLLAELLPGINPFETSADNAATRADPCK